MNIVFDIQPRQSGKTTDLIWRMEHNDNSSSTETKTRFIGIKNQYRQLAEKHGVKLDKFISSANQLFDYLYGNKNVTLCIDEYLFLPKPLQSEINKTVCKFTSVIDNIYVKSTSPKLIDPVLYKLVTMERSIYDLPIGDYITGSLMDEYEYLYNNLLTHPNTKLSVYGDLLKREIGWEKIRTNRIGELFSK